MIHTDNQPIKHVSPAEKDEITYHHVNRARHLGCDIPPSVAEWMRQQDEARDPANNLRYAAA